MAGQLMNNKWNNSISTKKYAAHFIQIINSDYIHFQGLVEILF